MATELNMPQMGESVTEGTISRWLVKEGDTVERDQPLLEISTDKVDAEVPSPAAGTVLKILRGEGETVAVDELLAQIGEAGEKVADASAQPEAPKAAAEASEAPAEAKAPPAEATAPVAATAAPPAAEKAAADRPAPGSGARVEADGEFDRDLLIIGSGPGGYVAAIRAGQLGLKTAVIERDGRFGGTCTLRGCIPTKALLHSAAVLDEARDAARFGVRIEGEPKLDVDQAHKHKREVVDSSSKGISYLFKKNQVEGIHGHARLTGPHEVEVENNGLRTVYRARNILLATGSVPRELPFAKSDGKRILTSDHILELESVPKRLAVLGSGAVGSEFASMFASWGSEVALIEMLPRLLPIEDADVSKELERAFRKRGIACRTATTLKEVDTSGKSLKLLLEAEGGEQETLETDVLLVAVGRAPVTEGLALDAAGVSTEKGFIPANGTMQTAMPHIYAIGDVVDTPALAHVASHEGLLAVEHMAGGTVHEIDYDRVPSCTYCEPEVGSVGLDEEEAKSRGYDVSVGKFPFSASGKARIVGKTGGFVKVVREKKYDELLGVHVIGPHATDLIAEACVALQLESTTEELFHAMHAHPTLAETVAEAAHVAVGQPVHI